MKGLIQTLHLRQTAGWMNRNQLRCCQIHRTQVVAVLVEAPTVFPVTKSGHRVASAHVVQLATAESRTASELPTPTSKTCA